MTFQSSFLVSRLSQSKTLFLESTESIFTGLYSLSLFLYESISWLSFYRDSRLRELENSSDFLLPLIQLWKILLGTSLKFSKPLKISSFSIKLTYLFDLLKIERLLLLTDFFLFFISFCIPLLAFTPIDMKLVIRNSWFVDLTLFDL